MATNSVKVNRAPVLTLWAAVVAERHGFDWPEALTLGKAVAGLNAQAKGRRLGIYGPPKGEGRGGHARKAGLGEEFWVDVCGRPVPARQTDQGVRAVVKADPIDPDKVHEYLKKKFGDALDDTLSAMRSLAGSFEDPEELENRAYGLYELFRPAVARGRKGWGQAGELDLDMIRSLAEQ